MSKVTFSVSVALGQSLSTFASLRGASLKAFRVSTGAIGGWVSFVRSESGLVGPCRGPDNMLLTSAYTPDAWCELQTADLAGVDRLAVRLCSDELGTVATQAEAVTIVLIALE